MHNNKKNELIQGSFRLFKVAVAFFVFTGFSGIVPAPVNPPTLAVLQKGGNLRLRAAVSRPTHRVAKAPLMTLERRLQAEWAVSTSC